MEELLEQRKILDEKIDAIDEERTKLSDERHAIQSKITDLEIHHLSDEYKARLIHRLKRLQAYVDSAKYCKVDYRIKKLKEPRVDDWHNPIPDFIDWTIRDFDILAMSHHVEVELEIYSPSVIKFVEDWIEENIPRMLSDWRTL